LDYLEDLAKNHQQPGETITIVVPQFIPSQPWHKFLHTNTVDLLRKELLSYKGIIVTDVPYHVE
jgi:hypothetical protein